MTLQMGFPATWYNHVGSPESPSSQEPVGLQAASSPSHTDPHVALLSPLTCSQKLRWEEERSLPCSSVSPSGSGTANTDNMLLEAQAILQGVRGKQMNQFLHGETFRFAAVTLWRKVDSSRCGRALAVHWLERVHVYAHECHTGRKVFSIVKSRG